MANQAVRAGDVDSMVGVMIVDARPGVQQRRQVDRDVHIGDGRRDAGRVGDITGERLDSAAHALGAPAGSRHRAHGVARAQTGASDARSQRAGGAGQEDSSHCGYAVPIDGRFAAVPPMINRVLPVDTPQAFLVVGDHTRFVARRVGSQLPDQFRPRAAAPSGRRLEFPAIHRSVADLLVVRLDGHVETVGVAQQEQQVVFARKVVDTT